MLAIQETMDDLETMETPEPKAHPAALEHLATMDHLVHLVALEKTLNIALARHELHSNELSIIRHTELSSHRTIII